MVISSYRFRVCLNFDALKIFCFLFLLFCSGAFRFAFLDWNFDSSCRRRGDHHENDQNHHLHNGACENEAEQPRRERLEILI